MGKTYRRVKDTLTLDCNHTLLFWTLTDKVSCCEHKMWTYFPPQTAPGEPEADDPLCRLNEVRFSHRCLLTTISLPLSLSAKETY